MENYYLINLNTLLSLTQLRRGETKYGLAPHKPVLVLAILEIMEASTQAEQMITLDTNLKESFSEIWDLLVVTRHTKDITKPIYHLQADKLWKVKNTSGNLAKPRAISTLLRENYNGFINGKLFQSLINKDNVHLARMIILDTYFPKTKDMYFSARKPLPNYISDIEKEIIEDPKANYRTKWTQEAGFVRDWKFSNKVKELYNYTCCMSRYKIEYKEPIQHSLIEAAHIEPHSETGNSYITNGIPLLVNLHRAFDSGLIGVNDNYEVIVNHKKFKENKSQYNLGALHEEKILLPSDKEYYPSLEKFREHRLSWEIR